MPCDIVSGLGPVLFVEDNDDIREVVRELLTEFGFRCIAVPHGAACLQWLDESGEMPCVVLLDWIMPVMDGAETLARLRGDARWRDLRVVLMTAASGVHVPGVRVLMKPVKVEDILTMLGEYCSTA